MSTEWIEVSKRVPCDRRTVLVWVRPTGPMSYIIKGYWTQSRYNLCRNGGGFDIERRHSMILGGNRVTHWADVESPNIVVLQPPSKP